MKGVQFVEGFPDMDRWMADKKRLVVIDDLMSETDDRVTKLFTKGSHHRHLSVMYIVQNLFGKNKKQRRFSLNSHCVVLFKNPLDAAKLMCRLAKQIYQDRTFYVQESFKAALWLFVDQPSTRDARSVETIG